jgi:hypothetical protein
MSNPIIMFKILGKSNNSKESIEAKYYLNKRNEITINNFIYSINLYSINLYKFLRKQKNILLNILKWKAIITK